MSNSLFLLWDGRPDKWILVRNDECDQRVWVGKIEDVPDDLADEIEAGADPLDLWERLIDRRCTALT